MMLLSLECNGCRATVTSDSNLLPAAQRKKENAAADGRRVENGDRNGRACPPSSPSKGHCKKTGIAKTKTKKKMASHSDSSEFCCTSSVGSCDAVVGGGGGGGDDKEAAAILSSTSFSSDSAEYYRHPSSSATRTKSKHKNTPPRRGARTCDTKMNVRHVEKEKAAAADVGRGVAVERLSTDLYGDFRRSMVEMIMARRKQLRAGDMSCLLRCYLSLNSPEHHPVIIKAFSDIYKGYSLPLPTENDF